MYKWSINYPKTFAFMDRKVVGTLAKIGRWLLLNFYFHLIAASFYLLSLEQIAQFYSNLGWSVNISLFAVFLFFYFTQLGQRPPRAKSDPSKDKK